MPFHGASLQALLALLLAGSASHAATCRQEDARYGDREAGLSLRFEPSGEEAAAASHRFFLHTGKGEIVFDGYVLPADEPTRSEGVVLDNCPEGDVTGDDLAACTIWEGIVYGVDAAGRVDLLPEGGSDAARTVVLADFGRLARASASFEKGRLSAHPSDIFEFRECR